MPVGANAGRVSRSGQTIDEFPERRLLQRAAAGIRPNLAASDAGHVDLLSGWRRPSAACRNTPPSICQPRLSSRGWDLSVPISRITQQEKALTTSTEIRIRRNASPKVSLWVPRAGFDPELTWPSGACAPCGITSPIGERCLSVRPGTYRGHRIIYDSMPAIRFAGGYGVWTDDNRARYDRSRLRYQRAQLQAYGVQQPSPLVFSTKDPRS
jgi:hypothetical protein